MFTSERSHNSQIFAPLEEALMSCNHAPSLNVVGTGPGSYTGIRIGIAAGLGLSMALKAPIIGIPSICCAESTDQNSLYHVIGDARRESWYVASVDRPSDHLQVQNYSNQSNHLTKKSKLKKSKSSLLMKPFHSPASEKQIPALRN